MRSFELLTLRSKAACSTIELHPKPVTAKTTTQNSNQLNYNQYKYKVTITATLKRRIKMIILSLRLLSAVELHQAYFVFHLRNWSSTNHE